MFIDKKERNPEIKKLIFLLERQAFIRKTIRLLKLLFRHIVSGWKDEPIMYEAMIWQAFTSCMEKDYSLAESTLDQVRNKIADNKAPKSLNKFLYSVYADNAIYQKKIFKSLRIYSINKKIF